MPKGKLNNIRHVQNQYGFTYLVSLVVLGVFVFIGLALVFINIDRSQTPSPAQTYYTYDHWQEYTSNNFSLLYPNDWKDISSSKNVGLLAPNVLAKLDGSTYILLVINSASTQSPQQYYKSTIKDSEGILQKPIAFKHNNYNFYVINSNLGSLASREYLISNGKEVVILSFAVSIKDALSHTTTDYAKYLSDDDKIAKSIKFNQ